MSPNKKEAAAKIDHYKVNPGEPGCDIVTEFKDGLPILKNPPLIPAPPPSSSLPAIIQEQTKNKSIVSSAHQEISYYRFAIIKALWKEISQKPGIKKHKIIKQFLKDYNSGSLLPNVFEKLGRISRPTIYRWIKNYKEGDIEALIPQCRGPEASEITDYEKYILLDTFLNQNRLKIGTAIKFTKTILNYKQIPSPSSESRLRRFLEEFQKTRHDVCVYAREGAKALNDKCLPYAERDWSLLGVGDGLVADGHRLNFQVINPDTGKPCRATIVLFWDWKSAYPLGWEIMLEESTQCIASALRNAILTLGKIPKWLLIDNGKAFKAKYFNSEIELEDGILYGMFATLGIHTHFSQAYNPQEKPLERFWGTFNNWFERLFPSYIGASINDKPAWMRRNEKEAQARHSDWVPKIEEVQELLYNWREFYADQPSRGRDGMKPGEIFNAEKGPGVDPAELYHLMMAKEKMQVHRNGITFNGWHYYNEALYGIKDYIVGKYSHSDYSRIYCFYKNQFLCVAEPIEKVHPMASESEYPKDHEAVKKIASLKSRVKRGTKNFISLIESGKDIDWERSRSPEVKKVVKAIEDSQETPKMISPFLDEPQGVEPIAHKEEKKTGRPWFADEYERYNWTMKQEAINQEDRDFIPDFRSRSLLYKDIVFHDEEELDRKVLRYNAMKMQFHSSDENGSIDFNYAWKLYEHLLKQESLTEGQARFIEEYKSGIVAPGEWESIYGPKS